jgi:hypothetical protein
MVNERLQSFFEIEQPGLAVDDGEHVDAETIPAAPYAYTAD